MRGLVLMRHGAALRPWALVVLVGLLGVEPAAAQNSVYGTRLGVRDQDGVAAYRPTGVTVYSDALDPSVGRWYLPAVFFTEAGRRQSDYINNAAQPYRRFGG